MGWGILCLVSGLFWFALTGKFDNDKKRKTKHIKKSALIRSTFNVFFLTLFQLFGFNFLGIYSNKMFFSYRK